MIRYVSDAPDAPKAIGPYSQVTLKNGTAYLSGQIPLDPSTMKIVEGGIEAQTEQVMKNLSKVLSHVELSFSHVMSATIYLTDLGNFEKVNAIYDKWLNGSKPARATVQVAGLPRGSLVEISMIAAA
jgi:2-iminobutanoate/2-iminopropanoate deaminase